LEEARAAGLTLSSLRGNAWRRIGSELYCWTGMREEPRLVLLAWQRVLPAEAVFGGASAAWVFGLDLEPTDPVEVVCPPRSGIRLRSGLRVRRCELAASETVNARGLRVTTLHRTLLDLCAQRLAVEALVAIDMAVHLGLTDRAALVQYGESSKGRAGARRLRQLGSLAATAESPMETCLRWLLIQAGLPQPEVQMDLRDNDGRFVGRADLYYPAARLVVEYDGGNHRDRLVEDDRRQNLLINAGYSLLRFTAADIHQRQEVVLAQVRGALGTTAQVARLAPKTRNFRSRGARLAPNGRKWTKQPSAVGRLLERWRSSHSA
jgi:very-short-patch-repair endonuclease